MLKFVIIRPVQGGAVLTFICIFTLVYLILMGAPRSRRDATVTVTLALGCITILMEQFGQVIHYTDWSFRVAVPVAWIVVVGRIYNLWPAKMKTFLDRVFDRPDWLATFDQKQ